MAVKAPAKGEKENKEKNYVLKTHFNTTTSGTTPLPPGTIISHDELTNYHQVPERDIKFYLDKGLIENIEDVQTRKAAQGMPTGVDLVPETGDNSDEDEDEE